jgi:hypothetical protein
VIRSTIFTCRLHGLPGFAGQNSQTTTATADPKIPLASPGFSP